MINKFTPLVFAVAITTIGLGGGFYLKSQGVGEKKEIIPTPINNQKKSTNTFNSTNTANDQKHKDNLSDLMSSIKDYMAFNNGAAPTTFTIKQEIIPDYMSSDLINPVSGKPYIITSLDPISGEIQYKTYSQCSINGAITRSSSSKDIVLRVLLSTGEKYCLDN